MQRQPVDMVDNFCRQKIAAKFVLHHKAMFKNQLTDTMGSLPSMWVVLRRGYENISIKVDSPSCLELVVF